MVRGQEGWFSMPSYRNSRARNSAGKEYTKKKIVGGKNKKAKATYEKCGGKIKGVFTKLASTSSRMGPRVMLANFSMVVAGATRTFVHHCCLSRQQQVGVSPTGCSRI